MTMKIHIMHMQIEGKVLSEARSEPGAVWTARSERKSLERIKDLVRMSPRPKHMVIDLYEGAYVIAMMWVVVQKHDWFTRFVIERKGFYAS